MTGWTVDTLHEHYTSRFADLERMIDRRIAAVDEARRISETVRDTSIAEAQRTIETRLQALNELRREVTEDRGQLVRRDVFDSRIGGLEQRIEQRFDTLFARIESLESWRNRSIGVISVLALASGGIGAFVGWVLNN